MAKEKKKVPDNFLGEKYRFDSADFIMASDWKYTVPGKRFFDDDYLRIVDFFCLHSPCRIGSYSSMTLENLGWRNPWKSNKFREKILSTAGLDDSNFKVETYQYKFKELWDTSGLPDEFTTVRHPFAYLAAAGETNDIMNLFHRIRNSFAHGRFQVICDHQEYYFYFEDVKSSNGCTYVLGRVCMTKSALTEWYHFLNRDGDAARGVESIISSHANEESDND